MAFSQKIRALDTRNEQLQGWWIDPQSCIGALHSKHLPSKAAVNALGGTALENNGITRV